MSREHKHPFPKNRRFNPWVEQMRSIFGGRVQKLALDAGFSCPNRDGRVGKGGCTFCDNAAFNPSYCSPGKSIHQQLDEGILFHKGRYSGAKAYLAYLQAYSNTYESIDILRARYQEALDHPLVKGLVVGTRPDCLPDEVLNLLSEIAKSHFIHLELGIESMYDTTLGRINRGHSMASSLDAIERSVGKGIRPGVHMMFGLPGESIEMMLAEAAIISRLPVSSIKFHQLQIIRGTAMESEYLKNTSDFIDFSLEQYIDFIIDFIERLRPDIMIERFAGEVPPRFRVNPGWGNIRYEQVIQRIEARLEERDSWQGRYWSG